MGTAARSGGAAALLLVVFGVAWVAGAALHPAVPGPAAPHPYAAGPASAGPQAPDPSAPAGAALPSPPAGDPQEGLTLVPLTTRLLPGRPGEYAFRLTGSGPLAAPPRVTVVRRDATGLVRPLPTARPDGTWRAPLTPLAAGGHRVLVEVTTVEGAYRLLTADLAVPGTFRPVPPTPSRVAEVDGYQVRLDGDLVAGAAAQVFATVGRGGRPVTDLEPLDGGFGRMEALRIGDLAPARVRPGAPPPAPTDRAGPGVAFRVEAPAAGTYRLFLDFRHDGELRTAVFTVGTA